MFTEAKRELRELMMLVAEVERYDTTLAKEPGIVPTQDSIRERARKGDRIGQLVMKYELS